MTKSQDFLFITGRAELDTAPLVLLHGSGMYERNLIGLRTGSARIDPI